MSFVFNIVAIILFVLIECDLYEHVTNKNANLNIVVTFFITTTVGLITGGFIYNMLGWS